MVNVSWINKTLLENFNKERNHFHTADKTRVFEYILEYFRNLSLDVTSDNFTIDDGPNYQVCEGHIRPGCQFVVYSFVVVLFLNFIKLRMWYVKMILARFVNIVWVFCSLTRCRVSTTYQILTLFAVFNY